MLLTTLCQHGGRQNFRFDKNIGILPAATNGAISIYVTNSTDVLVDVTGYYVATTGVMGAVLPITSFVVDTLRKLACHKALTPLQPSCRINWLVIKSSCCNYFFVHLEKSMRSALTLVSIATVLLTSRLSSAQAPAAVSEFDRGDLRNVAPVVASDAVRESLPNDYLRITFVPAGVSVTTISRAGSLRGFATATPLYSPPLKVADFPTYSGLINNDQNVLVAMRCRPHNLAAADAVLATWPNVFLAIQRDLALNPNDCSAQPTDIPTQVACFAHGFSDVALTAVPTALAHTFIYAATLYDGSHTSWAQWLQSNYGIYPAFAGTGYSVKDSYYLSTQPMTSQQMLVKSVSSEYILRNVPLVDAGCSCISVPPYQGRSNDRLDPEFIVVAGGYGTCAPVNRLRVIQTDRGW